MQIGQYIIEMTVILLILGWIISNAGQFNSVVTAFSQTITGAFNALIGG